MPCNWFRECRDFNRATKEAWKVTEKLKGGFVDIAGGAIATALARRYTATAEEIEDAYRNLGSWDRVIEVCEESLERGVGLTYCVADKLPAAGRKGAEAGKQIREDMMDNVLFSFTRTDVIDAFEKIVIGYRARRQYALQAEERATLSSRDLATKRAGDFLAVLCKEDSPKPTGSIADAHLRDHVGGGA